MSCLHLRGSTLTNAWTPRVEFETLRVETDSLSNHQKSRILVLCVTLKYLKFALKINAEKTMFCVTTLQLLGHIITNNKIMMDPIKIDKVKNWQIPQSAKQVKQFLCLANNYHHFIQNFAEIASPLYKSLQKTLYSNGLKNQIMLSNY